MHTGRIIIQYKLMYSLGKLFLHSLGLWCNLRNRKLLWVFQIWCMKPWTWNLYVSNLVYCIHFVKSALFMNFHFTAANQSLQNFSASSSVFISIYIVVFKGIMNCTHTYLVFGTVEINLIRDLHSSNKLIWRTFLTPIVQKERYST